MRIQKLQKLTDLKWLNMFNVAFIDKNGKDKTWQVATRQKEPKCVNGEFDIPDAVVIVPYHTDRKKVVITTE